MSFFLCIFLWVICIGVMFWADVTAKKHIQKGWDDAWK
ncbi:hypothetical protein UFOVP37_9 [uncultured Caudovirales phage]|uniref:Uncharacterized protein n=1 Tax=uncultured Caudovirales phage TaxID=2100421 RepID=A0A6J5KNH1_9CAUD|nr:hypothetical protein UFOVP37_9 [uncultured Caudovirales phage]